MEFTEQAELDGCSRTQRKMQVIEAISMGTAKLRSSFTARLASCLLARAPTRIEPGEWTARHLPGEYRTQRDRPKNSGPRRPGLAAGANCTGMRLSRFLVDLIGKPADFE